jgi:hypothetical protein
MKSPDSNKTEAADKKTVSPISIPLQELEPEFAEERIETAEAHDIRREAGHSRKNERHVPERSNQVQPHEKS